MKKQLLSAAIAAASLAGVSQSAFAWDSSVTPDIEIFMAGASAQDKTIKNLYTTNMCDPATVTYYVSATANAHAAYFCTIKAGTVTGIAVDKKVLFHKRSAGGSAQGVNPLINATPIAHMLIGPACETTGLGTSASPYVCPTTQNANKISDAGVSDVEPTQFYGPNTPTGSTPVVAATANANLNVVPAAALVFGVPVSEGLYSALQKAQGITDPASPKYVPGCLANAYNSTTVGAELGVCMPSLSKEQVATLASGQIKKWDEFKINNVALTTFVGADKYAPTADGSGAQTVSILPTNINFHYCKRVNGSGTGAQQYIKFLGFGGAAPLSPDWASTPGGAGRLVHIVSGAGDMDNCLEDWSKGTNLTAQRTSNSPSDVFTAGVMNTALATGWAIGQQSLESNANVAKRYKFIKIDGVAPTLENTFRGKYMDWVEQTFQWRKGTAAAIAANPVTTEEVAILTLLTKDAASPTILGTDVNLAYNHPFGQSGYLAIGKNFAWSDNLDLNAPAIPYSHSIASGALNNASVPVIPGTSPLTKNKPL